MKILIVSPGRLPVPAVEGGAVETLIDLLIDYNEALGKHDIYVASVWSEKAETKSCKYKHTKYLYVKRNKLEEIATEKHFLPFRVLDYFYMTKVMQSLACVPVIFDRVVIENELVNGSVFIKSSSIPTIYHAHNDTVCQKSKKDCDFLKSCKKVIAVSEFLADRFRKAANVDNVSVVYNGVNTEMFQKEKYIHCAEQIREKYNVGQNDIVIVFAGRLVKEKGILELIKALRRVPDTYSIVLMIIGASFFGTGRNTSYVRNLKEECKRINHRIIFTGYIRHSDMPAYYAAADIGCVPSLWDEPFGLTVAEQMAMSLPVITTESGAIQEIVKHKCACLIKRDGQIDKHLAASIMNLAQDEDKRKEMGKTAREVIENSFSQKHYCEEWFNAVCGGEQNG